MGNNAAKPATIERQIAERREHISSRIQGVQERVRNDVSEFKGTAKDQASNTLNQTKSKLDFGSQTREHPYSMLAAATGLGVVLGIASEGLPSGGAGSKPGSNNGASSNGGGGNGGGAIGGMVMSVIGPAADSIRDELQQVVREGFSTLRDSTGIGNSGQSNRSDEIGSERATPLGH
jgi:ElaB/YqjD/DUF883 family membrane-anchored ribosome-binding protein